jgi:hypothetical protein
MLGVIATAALLAAFVTVWILIEIWVEVNRKK